MDIKAMEEKVKEVIEKAKSDEAFHAELKGNPVKAIEGLLGVDLPDEQIKAVAETVKAKLNLEKAEDGLKGAVESVEEKISGFLHKDK